MGGARWAVPAVSRVGEVPEEASPGSQKAGFQRLRLDPGRGGGGQWPPTRPCVGPTLGVKLCQNPLFRIDLWAAKLRAPKIAGPKSAGPKNCGYQKCGSEQLRVPKIAARRNVGLKIVGPKFSSHPSPRSPTPISWPGPRRSVHHRAAGRAGHGGRSAAVPGEGVRQGGPLGWGPRFGVSGTTPPPTHC